MDLKEISLTELLNNTSGTEFFMMFAKLIGRKEPSVFYEGVGDDKYYLLEELENAMEYEVPSHYLNFLSYLNGGSFLGLDLFSLAEKEYNNSLYNRNIIMDIRSEIGLTPSQLIIGKTDSHILYVDCLDDDSYTLMDIRNKEKIEFENLNALIGFLFYMLAVNASKKEMVEKEKIEKEKEKIYQDILKTKMAQRKQTQKTRDKIRAKAAAKALKELQKKAKKRKS